MVGSIQFITMQAGPITDIELSKRVGAAIEIVQKEGLAPELHCSMTDKWTQVCVIGVEKGEDE